jgi:hypothetical protein
MHIKQLAAATKKLILHSKWVKSKSWGSSNMAEKLDAKTGSGSADIELVDGQLVLVTRSLELSVVGDSRANRSVESDDGRSTETCEDVLHGKIMRLPDASGTRKFPLYESKGPYKLEPVLDENNMLVTEDIPFMSAYHIGHVMLLERNGEAVDLPHADLIFGPDQPDYAIQPIPI